MPTVIQGPSRDALLADYERQFGGLVDKNKRYPPLLRRMGREGEVTVKVSVDLSTGKVLDATVVKSSGIEVMDRNALETARTSAASLPGIKQIQEERAVAEAALATTRKFLGEIRNKLSDAKDKLAKEKMARQQLESEIKSSSTAGGAKLETDLRDAVFREKSANLLVNFYLQEESRAAGHIANLTKVMEEQNRSNRHEILRLFNYKLEPG